MSASEVTAGAARIEVREAAAEDEPEILALLNEAFDAWPRGLPGVEPGAFYRWKHREGAFGPSMALIARREGELAGYAAYLPWRFTGEQGDVESVRGVDFAVSPRHRRLGVSMAIREYGTPRFGPRTAFVWSNPNSQSRPGGAKAGRVSAGRSARWAGPGGLRGAASRRLRARSLTISPPLAAQSVEEALSALGGEPPARAVPAAGTLATARDGAYLRWRYGRYPQYRALTVAGADGEGLLIFRMRARGRLLFADVCELLVAPGDVRGARSLFAMLRREAPCDLIRSAFESARMAAACGCARMTDGGTISVFPLRPGLAPDPTAPGALVLSRGDLELL